MKSLAGLAAVLLLLSGCSSKAAQPAKQPETPSKSEMETLLLQPATVTEAFHLRGECAALGKKKEENLSKMADNDLLSPNNKNPVAAFTTVKTNYSVSANRCYLLIDTNRSDGELIRLEDGQTEDTLALAVKYTNGSKSRGFIGNALDGHGKETDYSKASDYINRLMDGGEPKE